MNAPTFTRPNFCHPPPIIKKEEKKMEPGLLEFRDISFKKKTLKNPKDYSYVCKSKELGGLDFKTYSF